MAQLRQLGKKQKINLNKILEAEMKKDTFEEAFRSTSDETASVLASTIEKHDFVMLESLCYYIDAYTSFFCNGSEYLQDMKTLLTHSKQIVMEVSYRKFNIK